MEKSLPLISALLITYSIVRFLAIQVHFRGLVNLLYVSDES